MRGTVALALALLVLAAVPGAGAVEFTKDELSRFDATHSRYKVSPEMVPRIMQLLKPHELDSELPGGWLLDGITIERFFVRLTLLRGEERFGMLLLPPALHKEGASSSPSFAIVSEGTVPVEARDALLGAIARNDDGSFWPEAPAVQAQEGNTVPPSVRKVHFSQLVGDFLLVLLVVAVFMGAGAFVKSLGGLALRDWWVLVAVGAYALAVRGLYYALVAEHFADAVWTSSGELPHVSAAWFLNTLNRFVVVNLDLVALLNVALGTLTVVAVFLLFRLMFEGLISATLAALFVAGFPAHVALSGTATLMVPFCALLALLALVQMVYEKSGDGRILFLSGLLALVTLFLRPEALLIVPVLVVMPFVRKRGMALPRYQLIGYLAAQAALVFLRVWSLRSGPPQLDPFLTWQVDIAAFYHNFGVWFVNLGRTPLIVMLLWAIGLAARPWKRDRWTTAIMAWWLLAGYVLYFHVDMTQSHQGGRVLMTLLVPLAWLVAWAGHLLVALSEKRRRWALVLVVVWLLLAPAIHYQAVTHAFKAVYSDSFIVEA